MLFAPKPNVDPLTVIQLIQAAPKNFALDGQDKIKVKLELPGAKERVRAAHELLTRLGQKPQVAKKSGTR